MKDRNWLEIDVGAVLSNIRLARSTVTDKKLMLVVKADCYGLGAELASFLEDAADSFGVATLDEALKLRRMGISKDVLVLGGIGIDKDSVRKALENDVSLSVSDCDSAALANSLAGREGKKLKVQLAVDSGMSRWGFMPDDKNLYGILSLKNLSVEGVFSHLAKADEENDDKSATQIEIFADLCTRLAARGFCGATHILNSAGIFRYPRAFGNTARLGIAAYGYAPSGLFSGVGLKACAKWYARVVSVREVKKGTSVSYGATYSCDKNTVLATLAVGYADGYPRALSGTGKVFAAGKTFPIAGRVCMDQCVIDIGDAPLKPGDAVELAGANVTVEQIARNCDTINYEILSRISKRTERHYVF